MKSDKEMTMNMVFILTLFSYVTYNLLNEKEVKDMRSLITQWE